MSLFCKLDGNLVIKSDAKKFHDVFGNRPHHVPDIVPHHVQNFDVHEGDSGAAGAVVYWNYTHDGKECVAKEIVEAIDHEKNSTTFKVIEGDILEPYKSIKITVQATPIEEGGSLVTWSMEYEKLHEGSEDPHSLLEYAIAVSKDIDAHLQEQV